MFLKNFACKISKSIYTKMRVQYNVVKTLKDDAHLGPGSVRILDGSQMCAVGGLEW